MNWKGIVSAVVFLTVVSAVRMGDKALFAQGGDRQKFVDKVESQNKVEAKSGKYKSPTFR